MDKKEIIDKTIHEPNRLRIMAQLSVIEVCDMVFLQKQLSLTWGNLSSHLTKLESTGNISINKEFIGKKPKTTIKITDVGKQNFEGYRQQMKEILD